ncbi:inositol monophosphatase family protein [Streptomyces sp. IMTB 2501]|uniref:inositol monophosphatase family protein n=1 Tax=Streptomyces sp. IMTB 2501 TaxID=1776340 RepID=UPI0021166E32|nr:inositol monophosphatase family protein [Streptomyces sp. IMTB 2501]
MTPSLDRRRLLHHAEEAVASAESLLRAFEKDGIETSLKASGEEVTQADRGLERHISGLLREHAPGLPLLGEETTRDGSVPETGWILDPIDGTMNFARGAPYYAIALGLVDAGRPVLGVVSAPRLQLRIAADVDACPAAEPPATRARSLSRAIVGVSGTGSRRLPAETELVTRLQTGAYRVRMHGSMCLDVVGVAMGWLDACVCVRPKPWDVAAGLAIARSRGYAALSADGGDFTWSSPVLVVAHPELAAELLHFAWTVLSAAYRPREL